jgi:hypothetical protein
MLRKTKANWKSVKYFIEYYDLSKAQAYKLIKLPGFPYMNIGEKGIRVNMSETDNWFKNYFGR